MDFGDVDDVAMDSPPAAVLSTTCYSCSTLPVEMEMAVVLYRYSLSSSLAAAGLLGELPVVPVVYEPM